MPSEYLTAGRIAAEVREDIRRRVGVGMSFVEICEAVEASVRGKGAEPAFPCNVCVNGVAAHYTAEIDDRHVVRDGDVVKIDVGVHISGYIADTATTLSFNPEYEPMVQAVEEVLAEAVKQVRAGVRTGDIGKIISAGAARRGYRPITNLSGHLIEPYQIHAGVSVPNVWAPGTPVLRSGAVYAVEPFLTEPTGAGLVADGGERNIFSLLSRRRTGERELDAFVEAVWRQRHTLPFAARFFVEEFAPSKLEMILARLLRLKMIRAYPVLVERTGKYVVQAEHTVVPVGNGVVVLTR